MAGLLLVTENSRGTTKNAQIFCACQSPAEVSEEKSLSQLIAAKDFRKNGKARKSSGSSHPWVEKFANSIYVSCFGCNELR